MLPALLVAGALLLPRALRGDGSIEAGYSLAVRYTLGLAAFALAIAGAAAGAASMAADRRSGALSLTLVKPPRPATLFAGKWLGVSAYCALLLALCHALVLLPLRFGKTENNEPYASRMVSRGIVGATLTPSRVVARQTLEQWKREERLPRIIEQWKHEGRLPKDATERDVLKELARQAEQGYDAANNGESITWFFHFPRALKSGAELGLRLTFDQQWGMLGAAKGVVAMRPLNAKEWACEMEIEGSVLQEVEVPFSNFDPAGYAAFEVRFTNTGGDNAESVLIHPGRGVALLVHGQNFWANAVRAYALQLALIAAFAALGVMLGAAFSMPVAAFAATVLYVLSMIAPALAEEIYPADEDEKKGFMMRAGEAVTLAMQKSFEPLLSPEPLTKLTRGEKIPTPTLTRALTLGALCFPGLAMLAFWAILGLRRSQEDG